MIVETKGIRNTVIAKRKKRDKIKECVSHTTDIDPDYNKIHV